MILDMVGLYLREKADQAELRRSLHDRVEKAFQSFSDAVAKGDEDRVARELSDLIHSEKKND
jgi:hypothetical protein